MRVYKYLIVIVNPHWVSAADYYFSLVKTCAPQWDDYCVVVVVDDDDNNDDGDCDGDADDDTCYGNFWSLWKDFGNNGFSLDFDTRV